MSRFDLVASVRRAWKSAPWLTIAVAVHAVALAGMVIWVIGEEREIADVPPVQVALRPPPTAEVTPPPLPQELSRNEIPPDVPAEVVEHARDLYHDEPFFEREDWSKEVGDPEAMEDQEPAPSSTAVGVGIHGRRGREHTTAFSPTGVGNAPFGRRPGDPQGMTQGTEKAVLEGLRWLLRHGNEDGSWSAATCAGRCLASGPCLPADATYTSGYDVGLTGLALLCFLGAGWSNESDQTIADPETGRAWKVGVRIKDGLLWLQSRQHDGSFAGDGRAFLYNEALAAMAMIENYGLSRNRYWKAPAQEAVDYLCRAQRRSPNGDGWWGWRYASREDVERERAGTGDDAEHALALHDADVSVTTWCVMALKSAQLAGLDVPEEHMRGALDFARWCTDPRGSGLVGYLSPDGAGLPVEGPGSGTFDYHVGTMSALGMLCRIFVAHDPEDPVLEQSAGVLLKDLPSIDGDRSSIDYYYWYYGSLALNQLDGKDSPRHTGKYWRPWEQATATALLELQGPDDAGCGRGGWLVEDRWTHYGGPIYATAINVPTLEVYYRYANAFGSHARETRGESPK